MGWRLHRRLRLLPGIWINLSKSGASLSLGGHGGTVNVNPRGWQVTNSLPGTGLSYRHQRHPFRRGGPASLLASLLLGIIGLIFGAIGIGFIALVIAVLLGAIR